MTRTHFEWLLWGALVLVIAFTSGVMWHSHTLEDRNDFIRMEDEVAKMQTRLSEENACENELLALKAKKMRETLRQKGKDWTSPVKKYFYDYSWEDIALPVLPPCLQDWLNPRHTVAGEFLAPEPFYF